MRHLGQCHCGKLKAAFETAKEPRELGVRACQCDFCRRHVALNTSDPDGEVVVDAAATDVVRYRFGLKTADFLLCRDCGVYIAAAIGEAPNIRSTINVAGLQLKAFLDLPPVSADYDAETVEVRLARRFTKWTPTRFTSAELQGSYFGPHRGEW